MNGLRLYQLLERTGTLLRAEHWKRGSHPSLQPVHLQALHYLACANRYSNTPAGVTAYLGATKGTVSQTLRVLEREDLLTKHPDPQDRRVVHLELTIRGRQLLRDSVPPAFFTQALADLPPSHITQLETSLTQLLQAMQRAYASRSFGICHTCRFFQRGTDEYRCGLTLEPLTEDQTHKICREHEYPLEEQRETIRQPTGK